MYRYGHGIGHGMVYVDKLHFHTAELNAVARFDCVFLYGILQAVFLKLVVNKTERKRRAVNRQVDFFKQVRQRAYVVLVAVRKDYAAYLVGVALNKREVRYNEVHAEHIAVGESHAAVNDYHVAFALKERKVLSDFVKAAQKINVYRRLLPAPAPSRGVLRRARLFGIFLHCRRAVLQSCGLNVTSLNGVCGCAACVLRYRSAVSARCPRLFCSFRFRLGPAFRLRRSCRNSNLLVKLQRRGSFVYALRRIIKFFICHKMTSIVILGITSMAA